MGRRPLGPLWLLIFFGSTACGPDVMRGVVAIGTLDARVVMLKDDGSVWQRTEVATGLTMAKVIEKTDAVGFADRQLCLRLPDGAVSCPLLLRAPYPPEGSREVSFQLYGDAWGHARFRLCVIAADGVLSCTYGDSTDLYSVGEGLRDVSAGAYHYCAIDLAGTPSCRTYEGQSVSRHAPVPPVDLTNVTEMVSSARDGITVARTADGNVWELDEVRSGQVLGFHRPVVQLADGMASSGIPAWLSYCGLQDDGRVFCFFGRDEPAIERRDIPRRATSIAGGFGYFCALLDDTTVWCARGEAGGLVHL